MLPPQFAVWSNHRDSRKDAKKTPAPSCAPDTMRIVALCIKGKPFGVSLAISLEHACEMGPNMSTPSRPSVRQQRLGVLMSSGSLYPGRTQGGTCGWRLCFCTNCICANLCMQPQFAMTPMICARAYFQKHATFMKGVIDQAISFGDYIVRRSI